MGQNSIRVVNGESGGIVLKAGESLATGASARLITFITFTELEVCTGNVANATGVVYPKLFELRGQFTDIKVKTGECVVYS